MASDKMAEEGSGVNGANGRYDPEMDRMESLNKIRTASSVSISPELFEKLYLSPPNQVKGQLRKTFGNPTPIALVGFLLSLSPLSCDLMGWRGAGGGGAATTSVYFFMGGILMVIGGTLEFVLGNTFPSVVFTSFGGFWLSYGGVLAPAFNAAGAYAPAGTTGSAMAAGAQATGYNASLAFFFLFMGFLCFMYLICSLRTNIAFVIIFLSLVLTFGLISGAYWSLASDFVGNAALANRCLVGAGACAFVTSMAGWWILFAIMLANVDFPIQLPVGDLSTIIKGRSDRMRAKQA